MTISKIKYFFLLLFIKSIAFSYSQSISRSVVSSSGRYVSNTSGALLSNVGEVVVQTFFTTSNILTEGFEQPINQITTNVPFYDSHDVDLYPNPVVDNIYISSNYPNNSFIIEFFDVQGRKLVLNSKFEKTAENTYTCNLSLLDNGIYFIKIFDKRDNKLIGFRKLVKI